MDACGGGVFKDTTEASQVKKTDIHLELSKSCLIFVHTIDKTHIVMRKITQQSVEKFMNAEPFKSSNTEVVVKENVTILKLFGNEIAYRYNDPEQTLSITNCGWMTNTTKERLNGIPSVNIYQRKGKWFLNDQEWDGELIDVK